MHEKCSYCETMQVTWERVSWLIGFHHNVGKTLSFTFDKKENNFCIYYTGTQNGTCKISRENVHSLLEICENHGTHDLLPHNFHQLQYFKNHCILMKTFHGILVLFSYPIDY